MTTEDTIRSQLDDTHAAYATCWRTLAAIKEMNMAAEFREDFLDFQPMLAKALCNLDRTDRILKQDHAELVRQKRNLPYDQFIHQIKRLGKFQEAIREAIHLGKTLGDTFAWFFYQTELPLLYKHLEHERVTETPTGVGHDGELAFLNNIVKRQLYFPFSDS